MAEPLEGETRGQLHAPPGQSSSFLMIDLVPPWLARPQGEGTTDLNLGLGMLGKGKISWLSVSKNKRFFSSGKPLHYPLHPLGPGGRVGVVCGVWRGTVERLLAAIRLQ